MLHHPYRFGPFTFDPRSLTLLRGETVTPLAPQPARVLGLLLARAGQVVLRHEIEDVVWPDTTCPITRTQGLNTCMAQIRVALGDKASEPEYVETLARRGYRFRARVEVVSVDCTGPRPDRGTERAARIGRVALAIALAGVVIVQRAPSPATPPAGIEENRAVPAVALRTGQYLLSRTTVGAARQALPYLEEAARTNPGHAITLATLAEAEYWNGHYLRARHSAERALALDSALVRPRLLLARLAVEQEYDWPVAMAHLTRGLELSPQTPYVHLIRAHFASIAGAPEEAILRIDRALALDPVRPTVQGDVGRIMYWVGRYEDALAYCGSALELANEEVRPRAARCALDVLLELGRTVDALEIARELMREAGADLTGIDALARRDPVAALRRYHEWAVQPSNRESALGADDPYHVARGYAAMGDRSASLSYLELALEQRSRNLPSLLVDPRFDAFRTHPRYLAVAARITQRLTLTAQPATGTTPNASTVLPI